MTVIFPRFSHKSGQIDHRIAWAPQINVRRGSGDLYPSPSVHVRAILKVQRFGHNFYDFIADVSEDINLSGHDSYFFLILTMS